MKRITRYSIGLFVVLSAIIVISSCNKFKGSQEIPAYIYVEKFNLTTNYSQEGAATHAITDVWVYVDGNVQGCYELPTTIPVLENGTHKLALYPGVKLNGISSTRIIYPFYISYVIDSYTFKIGEVDTLQPSTRYYTPEESTLDFWMEDFETSAGNFTPVKDSDTTMIRTDRNDTLAWLSEDSHYSGHIWIGDTLNYFCVASEKFTDLPNAGGYTIMELDYKCDVEFEVGLLAGNSSSVETIELIYVNPTTTWKKIYVNLSPTITDHNDATYFKFFLCGSVQESSSANLYFDNIKLVYRDQEN